MDYSIRLKQYAFQARHATNALFFMTGISFASWASRIPDVKSMLHLSDAALGSVLFAMPVGSLTALPVAGIIIDKLGSKKVTFLSAFFYLVALPLLGYSSEIWQLVIGLFLLGFGSDMLNISMNVQAVNVEKIIHKSIMSSFHAVFSIGFMTGFALGGYFSSKHISPLIHLSICGLLMLVVLTAVNVFLIRHDHKSDKNAPLFAIPDKALMILGIICFCGMLSEGAMADWSVLYYKQIMTSPNGFATAGATAFSVMMVFGRFLGDIVVAKLGLQKTLLINCLLVVLGMSVALGFSIEGLVIAGFGLTGLGLSTIVPLIYSEAGHSKTMASGVALAAISTLGIAGFLIGPVMIGFISEISSLRTALASLILLGFIGALLTQKIKQ